MNSNGIGVPWKSLIGLVSVFVAQLVARATVQGVTVLPGNPSGWVTLLGGSAMAALIIYAKGNAYTAPQLAEKVAAHPTYAKARTAGTLDVPPTVAKAPGTSQVPIIPKQPEK